MIFINRVGYFCARATRGGRERGGGSIGIFNSLGTQICDGKEVDCLCSSRFYHFYIELNRSRERSVVEQRIYGSAKMKSDNRRK